MPRYVNETNICTSTYNNILYYEYRMRPTCFGQSCGHTKNVHYRRYNTKVFEPPLRRLP